MEQMEIALPQDGLLVVGWDPPLESFYGQAFEAGTMSACTDGGCFVKRSHVRRECQDELVTVWVGTSFGELPTVEDLEGALGDIGAALTEDAKAKLRQAKEASADHVTSPIVRSLLGAGFLGRDRSEPQPSDREEWEL